MNKLRWHLIVFRHMVGWSGILGLIGFTYAAIYFFTTVIPTQGLLENRHIFAASKMEQVRMQTTLVRADPTEQLKDFTNKFPSADTVNVAWEEVLKIADKSGLLVDRSIYTSSKVQQAGLLRYSLDIPVQATYPQIREFLAEVIRTMPNIALEQVSFKRNSADSAAVDAHIGWVMYVKAQG